MKKGIKAAALSALMLPAAAMAELNYNYVEGGLAIYPSAEPIITLPDSQTLVGFDVRGSYLLEGIDPNVFVFGGLKYLTDDLDLTYWHVGGGYRHSLDTQTDLWGGVTLEHQDFDYGSVCQQRDFQGNCISRFTFGGDDTALGLRGGVRHMLDEGFEIGGSLRLVTGDADHLGLTGTARYHWQDNLSFLGEIDIYDGELGFIGGVNYAF